MTDAQWSNAPPQNTPRQQRLKLLVMVAILGPMVLFGLYHMGRAAVKMYKGEAVGYQQRDTPPGIADE